MDICINIREESGNSFDLETKTHGSDQREPGYAPSIKLVLNNPRIHAADLSKALRHIFQNWTSMRYLPKLDPDRSNHPGQETVMIIALLLRSALIVNHVEAAQTENFLRRRIEADNPLFRVTKGGLLKERS